MRSGGDPVNARMERAAHSTPVLVVAFLFVLALGPFEQPMTWRRALTIWASGWAAFIVLVVTR